MSLVQTLEPIALGKHGITRILICSDPIMTSENEQKSNRQWLRDLLVRPITRATGIRVATFASSLVRETELSRHKFFALSDIALDIGAVQYWFDINKIKPESYDYLKNFLFPTDLVIGYELSAQMRRILTAIGVPYIDIWLHPVRFLDDILFGFGSNVPEIRKALDGFVVSQDLIYLYADRLKVQAYKGFRRRNLEIPTNSAIFIGQTDNDKSVMRNGKFLSLLDFQEKFSAIAQASERIYYSRHPYMKKGDEATLEYIRSFPNCEMTEIPAYLYLAHENINTVATISSSAGIEARYFGKRSHIFYQTVFPLEHNNPEHYRTICQDLINPAFWAKILAPVHATKADAPHLEYVDKKDKLRDMLAFYWGYASVDKVEDLRRTFNAFQSRIDTTVKSLDSTVKGLQTRKPAAPPAADPQVSVPSALPPVNKKRIIAEFERHLDGVDVVSFDLFDTLVVRLVDDPFGVVERIRPDSLGLSAPVSREAFIPARRRARDLVVRAKLHRGEEVALIDRYRAVARELGLTEDDAVRLTSAEEAADLEVLKPNRLGLTLLAAARAAGKKIAIATDTYYSRAFIETVLERAKVKKPDFLFVSSEIGLTKHTGNLFPHIIAETGVAAGRILHVGDNPEADFKHGRKAGLKALLVPNIAAIAARSPYDMKHSFGDRRFDLICRGLVTDRLFQLPEPRFQQSFTGGYPGRFGFSFFGPILFGLAKWTLDQAIARGVDNILFLSRDGEIVWRACELLRPLYPEAPALSYLYASRRSISLPLCSGPDDVLAIARESFSPTPLDSLLYYRFHLPREMLTPEALKTGGFSAPDETVRHGRDTDRLLGLLDHLMPQILERAGKERRLFLANAARVIGDAKNIAVMDIGHLGSMQMKLARLLDRPEIGGFYFATHGGIQDRVVSPGWYASYLRHELPPKADDLYNKYILLIELLFLNSEGSFVSFDGTEDDFSPMFRSTEGEEVRVDFATKLHKTALVFVRSALKLLGDDFHTLTLDPEKLAAPLFEMYQRPGFADAKLFADLRFENFYSGRGLRPFIETNGTPEQMAAGSIWKEGLQAYLGNSD